MTIRTFSFLMVSYMYVFICMTAKAFSLAHYTVKISCGYSTWIYSHMASYAYYIHVNISIAVILIFLSEEPLYDMMTISA